jgi:hypothetical protein
MGSGRHRIAGSLLCLCNVSPQQIPLGSQRSLFARVSPVEQLAETGQSVFLQTVLEEIAVDGLRRDCALAGGHDHLAVGRRHAARGI